MFAARSHKRWLQSGRAVTAGPKHRSGRCLTMKSGMTRWKPQPAGKGRWGQERERYKPQQWSSRLHASFMRVVPHPPAAAPGP